MLKELNESGQKEIQMIIFKLGNEEYSVPITSVQEIIMPQEETRIPKSPKFVEGVINLRGQIIPIIDGKKKFMLSSEKISNSIDERIMILDVNKETIGLIVDEVSEVIHLKVEEIESPPIERTDETEFIWGVGKYQDRLLILLDADKFLDISESANVKVLEMVSETIKQTDKIDKLKDN